MVQIEGPFAPKRILGPRLIFQILGSLDISSQQVKFDRKSIVNSILMGCFSVVWLMLLHKIVFY